MEFRKIVMTTLYARQQKRHRLKGRYSQNGLKKRRVGATLVLSARGEKERPKQGNTENGKAGFATAVCTPKLTQAGPLITF